MRFQGYVHNFLCYKFRPLYICVFLSQIQLSETFISLQEAQIYVRLTDSLGKVLLGKQMFDQLSLNSPYFKQPRSITIFTRAHKFLFDILSIIRRQCLSVHLLTDQSVTRGSCICHPPYRATNSANKDKHQTHLYVTYFSGYHS